MHSLIADPEDPNTIWRQDHMGMFRTRDGGERWERIEKGLRTGKVGLAGAPAAFGFPVALDPHTKTLYCVPLESDEYRMPFDGRLAVCTSSDGGDSWHPVVKGLSETPMFTAVLRTSLATDGLEPCGVYFGTTAGTLHASRNGGSSWTTLPVTLPRILCVSAFVI